MEGFERQDHAGGAAASHTMYTAPLDAYTSQMPEVHAAPTRLMTAEMHVPLPDVVDEVRAQVT